MATTELDLEKLSKEAKEVFKLIKEKKHFLLSGGAGSGKTYSLVEILRAVINDYPSVNIACITYTNAAVSEIEDRVLHDNLHVSTIHDFLWNNIKNFQLEIKKTLIELINDPEQAIINSSDKKIVDDGFFDDCDLIEYKEYVKISNGVISHDEVIVLATKMFEKYERLCSIVKDKYPFIFVDEYQDTNPMVVKILLEYMEKSNKPNVVGFFGDAMQSIYDGSIGNLDMYTKSEPPMVYEVFKKQNRRNPLQVINLANLIRTDGLEQQPSDDQSAPNMDKSGEVKQGEIKFLYSTSDSLEPVRQHLGWDFNCATSVKELNLTHSLIADKANFPELMRIYDKDKILEYIRNKVRKHLVANEPEYDSTGKTLAQVLEHVGNPTPTPTQRTYIENNPKYFELAKSLPYDHISKLYVDKDQLLDDKKNYVADDSKPNSNRDDLIKHLFKIENCIRLYESKNYNQFIKATDYSILSVNDKVKLNEAIQAFQIDEDISIGKVIELAHELGLVIKDDKVERFVTDRHYVYKQVCDVKYQEFRNVFDYLEGFLPFSTQHKTKGSEFSNVLVMLDNGNWNQYNFTYLFERNGTDSVKQRSEKIFYVCCTRAKEKLAVFFPNPTQRTVETALEWFGEDNVVNLDDH
ncbi:TPA: ATP-dependent helicase [Vibrio vulnificus]|uniref:UvrD-helicase domain-containing protein n=1 Tax=Vibrio vulnificus TaxID=672 RepID=UPI0019D48461|nr:UvrD-helicase domain-containing protein [Vibrio vulnificus]MBN8147543.1 ATP-dependent helicase [Vibrio vulnificus]HAS6163775.1 AAA family ATPase [Vibrio vulnificus]HDY7864537.1 ATP-dependent helicase [Vibrio vulnificus]HDY7878392.1 ATP-dependent helicase [Vibrio vulnificus]